MTLAFCRNGLWLVEDQPCELAQGVEGIAASSEPKLSKAVRGKDPPAAESDFDCNLESDRERVCLEKVRELGYRAGSDVYAFSTRDLSPEDAYLAEFYLPGCHVYTTGELAGSAFFGGDGAIADLDGDQQMIVTACAPPTTRTEKFPRGVNPLLGDSAPADDGNVKENSFPAWAGWTIISVLIGCAMIAISVLLTRRKKRGGYGFRKSSYLVKEQGDGFVIAVAGGNVLHADNNLIGDEIPTAQLRKSVSSDSETDENERTHGGYPNLPEDKDDVIERRDKFRATFNEDHGTVHGFLKTPPSPMALHLKDAITQ